MGLFELKKKLLKRKLEKETIKSLQRNAKLKKAADEVKELNALTSQIKSVQGKLDLTPTQKRILKDRAMSRAKAANNAKKTAFKVFGTLGKAAISLAEAIDDTTTARKPRKKPSKKKSGKKRKPKPKKKRR